MSVSEAKRYLVRSLSYWSRKTLESNMSVRQSCPISSLDTPLKSCHNGAQDIEDTLKDHERTTHRYGIRLAGVFIVNIPCIPTLDCPQEEKNNDG